MSGSSHRTLVERAVQPAQHRGALNDLAGALASLIEGAWLNQCLTTRHPFDAEAPIATALQQAGRQL